MIIYKNSKEIESIKRNYDSYCKLLNENAEKIVSKYKYLNNKEFIIYALSFIENRKKLFDILYTIIQNEQKFVSNEFVWQLLYDIEKNLLYNGYIISDGILSNTYDKRALENNIKQDFHINSHAKDIMRVLHYDTNTHTFTVNTDEINKEIDKHIFNTTNKKQESILKKIDEFNKICAELFDNNIIAYHHFNPFDDVTKIQIDEHLAKKIIQII